MAADTDTVVVELATTTENTSQPQEEEAKEAPVMIDVNDEKKHFVDAVANVEFEKSLLHKKIEKDVHDILDENVGWRVKDEMYRSIRKLRKKYPNMTDKHMMEVFDIDHTDLYNAYNNESALKDSDLKHAIRRGSDMKLIKKRYPLPVFSNQSWNLVTTTDAFLFWELIFEFVLMPIFLFCQSFFIFCYLIRNQLPVSGTTDLVLKDHFKVDIQSKKEREQRRRGSDAQVSDFYTLPRGYAVKDLICNKERPSQTACADFWCCCCRGIAIADYVAAVKHYEAKKASQKISLRVAQRQRLIQRHQLEDAAPEAEVDDDHDKDLTEELHKVDSERSKLLESRGCCAKKTLCCLCPTAWQMAPLLDVEKDKQARVNPVYWTPGYFNNCTPYDMLSWCFSTRKELDHHYAELRLIGNVSRHRVSCSNRLTLSDPRLILLFRLFLCICLTAMYALLWFNSISCALYVALDISVYYDLSSDGNGYVTDCVMEGILPILVFAITAFLIAFWASFRAKIRVPNISKLSAFKIHWYDFSNTTQEEMLQQTVKFTTFMNSQYGSSAESKMLREIEEASTTAKQFIQEREEVFRQRIKDRVQHSRILRFRHDFDYALAVRMSISLIIAALPTVYKLCDPRLNIADYDVLFMASSFVLNLLTFFLFFSFIQHQIFATDKLDLFSFLLNDITTIIQWPVVKDEENEAEKQQVEKRKSAKFGFVTARMDKFKSTTDTADIYDEILSSMDSTSLPYCNVLEHGNALSWVEMRSFVQGMIKALLSKLDMLLAVVIVLLFLTAVLVIYLIANHAELGNHPVFIEGIIVGCIVIAYLLLFNLIPLVKHGPKLRRLQAKQISGLEKQKLMATNIVNNQAYFDQFRYKAGGLWDDKLKQFAPELGLGFLASAVDVVKSGDFSTEGVMGMLGNHLMLKGVGVLAAAAFPTVVTKLF